MIHILISAKADERLIKHLRVEGHIVSLMEPVQSLDSPINYHADIFNCQLGDEIWHGDPSLLAPEYPGDVLYNGCSTGKYFIHNTKYTHPQLLEAAKSTGHTLVHVAQGYARCCALPVDGDSIITADAGIARTCRDAGLSVLLIQQGHILLPGFNYGFIGGCAGRVGDTVIFHGNLSAHPDGLRIKEFIRERNLKVKEFLEFPLTDIGSILTDDNTNYK